MSVSPPLPEIDQLSVIERLELISRLWDSIPESAEALPVPDWHREELERRIAEADAAPESGIPWEQVRSELRGTP
jgi:putative addiction module component (TIGR02574 family)